jgi:hypothetical protein
VTGPMKLLFVISQFTMDGSDCNSGDVGHRSLWAGAIRGGANNPSPALAGRDRLETQDASAALSGRDVAGGNLVFVGGEGCQNIGLLALRDLDEVQGPSEFRSDLIEFCGGDLEVPVGLLKAERRRAWLGGRELEGPPKRCRPTASA